MTDYLFYKKPAKSRFMNCRAKGNEAYIPTEIEHLANIITHGLLIVPSLIGSFCLLKLATSISEFLNALIYGLALTSLFTVSTTFHSCFYCGRLQTIKDVLHKCDRAVIYLFIAASYTPWLTLKEVGSVGFHMRWLVWILALFGILYQYLFHERYKLLETLFYVIIGITPSISVFSMTECSGVIEMGIGGFIYMLGVYFFKSDGRIPCAHAIWHLFVAVGAMFHYYAVSTYLMGSSKGNIL